MSSLSSSSPPARKFIDRVFCKPRKDGRYELFSISILAHKPDEIITKHGATNEERGLLTWYSTTPHRMTGRNTGRANYKNPEIVAEEEYQRMIQAKLREGYREIVEDLDVLEKGSFPQFREELPCLLHLDEEMPGFRPWKPLNSIKEGSRLWERMQQGKALFVRKQDGYGAMFVKDEGEYEVFSLRNQKECPSGGTILNRLPRIQRWIHDVGGLLPDKTMLLVEIIPNTDKEPPITLASAVRQCTFTHRSYEYVTSIIKSSIMEALMKQRQHGELAFYVWDILLWAGIPVGKTLPYRDRLGTISDIVQSIESGCANDGLSHLLYNTTNIDPGLPILGDKAHPALLEPSVVSVSSNSINPMEDMIRMAMTVGWEGFVVTDPLELFGDRAWSTTGRADRPACTGKLKPYYEDDFVAMWDPRHDIGEYGQGKHHGLIGAVNLYQWDEDELRFCGQCGTGFTDQQRRELMEIMIQPQVFQVRFVDWSQNGMLRFPSFLRLREDKLIENCLYAGPGSPSWDL